MNQRARFCRRYRSVHCGSPLLRSFRLWSCVGVLTFASTLRADSVNSPNVNINVDTNRATATGNGAGNVAIAINTVTIAETMLPEYSSGSGKAITIQAKPGYQFDPSSSITAQSTTIGLNGGAINAVATIVPAGTADELITFELTSGTNTSIQDIIRINGIKIRIISAEGAAGPAQNTLQVTTTGAGGAFSDQGIVGANIAKGLPDRLVFSVQPGDAQFNADILPAVSMVDFGGNIINNDPRLITISIEDNPGAATLSGETVVQTSNGVATWQDADDLAIPNVSNGYTLKATHDGNPFFTDDEVISGEFNVLAGAPDHLAVTVQPGDTAAGGPIVLSVSVLDVGDNVVTGANVDVTLDSAVNPGGWPLLVDTSLTKATVDGVAAWVAADNLRINKSTNSYKIRASGLSEPVDTDEFDVNPADPDHLEISTQPVDTVAGEDLFVVVMVKDEFNNTNTTDDVDVKLDLTTNPGAATLDVGTSLTKTSVDGVASWSADDDLRIDKAAAGYRMLASGVGAAGETDAFDIIPGALDHLTMTTQPESSLAGDDLFVTVETRDALENLIPANGMSITLSLSENPGEATLEVGTSLTKETVDGATSWAAADDLTINTAATGYRILASDGTNDVESDAFDITAAVANMDVCGTDCGTGSMMTLMPLLAIKLSRRRRRRR